MKRRGVSERGVSRRVVLIFAVATAALVSGSCATVRPPEVRGPRVPESGYPVVVEDDLSRREASLAAWRNLLGSTPADAGPNPELLPVTSTIQSMPEIPPGTLTLPVVGKPSSPNEEELRESLRRFLKTAGPVICGNQDQLTLVQRIDNADGTKAALYEQRPFRYRLRGDYGRVRIDFTGDRRVLRLNSSCLPDLSDALRDVAGLRPDPAITPAKIAASLTGRTFNTPGGAITVASASDLELREPVVLVRETATAPLALELRLAWEVMLKNGSPVYVDAVDGSILSPTSGTAATAPVR